MPKITLGITGVPESLGRDYGLEERYWGASLCVWSPFLVDIIGFLMWGEFYLVRGLSIIKLSVMKQTLKSPDAL